MPQLKIDRSEGGRWTISFSNPPINMFVPETIVELGTLMTEIEADPSLKAVVFESANPDFFVAHLDVAKAAERPETLGLWRNFVLRLASAPAVSIAKIRGRTRGIGNEFVLACDMRFASRNSPATTCSSPCWPGLERRRAAPRLVVSATGNFGRYLTAFGLPQDARCFVAHGGLRAPPWL